MISIHLKTGHALCRIKQDTQLGRKNGKLKDYANS
jgi:hypothetical protein